MMRRSTWQPTTESLSLFLRAEQRVDEIADAQAWADAHEPVMEAVS